MVTQENSTIETTTPEAPQRPRRGPRLAAGAAGIAVVGILVASALGLGADKTPDPEPNTTAGATPTVPAGGGVEDGEDPAGDDEPHRFDPALLLPPTGEHPDSVLPVDLTSELTLADPLPTLPAVEGLPLDLRSLVTNPGIIQVRVTGGGLVQDSALLAHQGRHLLEAANLMDATDPTLVDILIGADERDLVGNPEDWLDARVAVRARTEAGWLPAFSDPVGGWTLPLRTGEATDEGCLTELAHSVEYAGADANILANCLSTLVPGGDPVSVAVPYAGQFGTTWELDGEGWHAQLARTDADGRDKLLVWADEDAAETASLILTTYALTLEPDLQLGAGN